jgi:hypothetical protein
LQGVEAVQKGLATVQAGLVKIQEAAAKVADVAEASFKRATLALTGFISAGVAMSSMGQMFGFEFERFARTLAGLVRPELELFLGLLRRLTNWLQSDDVKSFVASIREGLGKVWEIARPAMEALWEAMKRLVEGLWPVVQVIGDALVPVLQGLARTVAWLSTFVNENTVKWLAAAAAFAVVFSWVPKIVSGIMAIVNAVRALNVALAIKEALSGPKGWIQLAAGVAAAAAAVGAFYAIEDAAAKRAQGMKAPGFGKKGLGGMEPLPPRLGGQESFEGMWARLAEASRLVGAGGTARGGGVEGINDRLDILIDETKTNTRATQNIQPATRIGKGA